MISPCLPPPPRLDFSLLPHRALITVAVNLLFGIKQSLVSQRSEFRCSRDSSGGSEGSNRSAVMESGRACGPPAEGEESTLQQAGSIVSWAPVVLGAGWLSRAGHAVPLWNIRVSQNFSGRQGHALTMGSRTQTKPLRYHL